MYVCMQEWGGCEPVHVEPRVRVPCQPAGRSFGERRTPGHWSFLWTAVRTQPSHVYLCRRISDQFQPPRPSYCRLSWSNTAGPFYCRATVMQSAVSVCLFVCLSVELVYRREAGHSIQQSTQFTVSQELEDWCCTCNTSVERNKIASVTWCVAQLFNSRATPFQKRDRAVLYAMRLCRQNAERWSVISCSCYKVAGVVISHFYGASCWC